MKRSLGLPIFTLIALLAILQLSALAGEKYHMVLVPNPSEATLRTIAELGIPLDCGVRLIKGEGLELPLSDSEISLLQSRGIAYRITRQDLEKYYSDICLENLKHIPPQVDTDPVHMKYGSMGGFYTWEQINADLDSMNLLYPGICAPKVSIGQGWNANPLYMVKISDNPGVQESEPEGEFEATIHAREPGGYASLMYAMWWLLENYGTDPEATYLVNNRQLYFVPVANPDGFRYNQQTNPNGGGMWRKNRRFNNPSYGVDCNRNFTYQWGYDNNGSSPTPSSDTYRGPSAGSEPETQAIMSLISAHNIKVSNDMHTFAGVYLCPYGWTTTPPPTADYQAFMEYMTVCTAASGYNFGVVNSPIMYAVNGGSIDWAYHDRLSMAMTVEVGTVDFWPPINYIMPDAQKNLPGLLYQFWVTGARLEGTDLVVSDGYLTPGATENLIATVINQGQSTSEPFTYELTTTSPYVTLTPNVVSGDPLLKRTSTSNSGNPFVCQLGSVTPLGQGITFNLVIHQGSYTRTKAYTLVVGTPNTYLSDNAEAGLGNWTMSGGWGTTTNASHSPTHSFADSPTGNYSSNTTRYMTLTNGINLSAVTAPWLDFWTRWEIEGGFDFAQVEVSINNGATWTAIPGVYTNLGTGQGVQTAGQPGYDGAQYAWVHEHMNLSAYTGQPNFKFRFKLRSDGGFNLDGWYVDDIQVTGFAGAPPNVALDLVYTSGSPVAPGGGPLNYSVTLTNNEAYPLPFDYWCTYSQGATVIAAFGPINRTSPAGPGYNINRSLTQTVPGSLPAGAWNYNGMVGTYSTSTVWATDFFPFTKSAVSDGGQYYAESALTGWEEEEAALTSSTPLNFELKGNYPNPFNPTTAISYQLAANSFVSLRVYDTAGRMVANLVNGWREAGSHNATFDGTNLASGIYVCRLQAGAFSAVKKMMLVK